MKYIFLTGAPGSKWSSVAKNIYYSPDIDRSDFTHSRTYWHDASGELLLMHLGAYWDPGMEFGDWFDCLGSGTRQECEQEFDRPFRSSGVRIVKSHVFANHVDFLRHHWPDCPVVTVYRGNDACLGWWIKCGHFSITYPRYCNRYYMDFRQMSYRIAQQNHGILDANTAHASHAVSNNLELCDALGIAYPGEQYRQDYQQHDITVRIIR